MHWTVEKKVSLMFTFLKSQFVKIFYKFCGFLGKFRRKIETQARIIDFGQNSSNLKKKYTEIHVYPQILISAIKK